jgi:hypothetical protein
MRPKDAVQAWDGLELSRVKEMGPLVIGGHCRVFVFFHSQLEEADIEASDMPYVEFHKYHLRR